MSLLNNSEGGSASKQRGSFKAICKHCSSSISHNKSFSNLTTYHKVNKYENCSITVNNPQIIFTGNNIFFCFS